MVNKWTTADGRNEALKVHSGNVDATSQVVGRPSESLSYDRLSMHFET